MVTMTPGVRPLCIAACLLLVLAGKAPGGAPSPVRGLVAFAAELEAQPGAIRIYLMPADGSAVPRAVSPLAGRYRAPAIAPDGRAVAYQEEGDGGDLVLVQRLNPQGEPAGEVVTVGAGTFPQWSRDGRRLLVARRTPEGTFVVVLAADGSQRALLPKPLAAGTVGRWSPDEGRLAVVAPTIQNGHNRWQLQVLDARTGAALMRLTLPEEFGPARSLEWSPDGESLALAVLREGRLAQYVVSLRHPEQLRSVPEVAAGEPLHAAGMASWAPDGEVLLLWTDRPLSGIAGGCLALTRPDGTETRRFWAPAGGGLRVFGTSWWAPPRPTTVAAPEPAEPARAPEPVVRPDPPAPAPAPAPEPEAGPAQRLKDAAQYTVAQQRSPLSVALGPAGAGDFAVRVPVLPTPRWAPRRQGVGISLELADGSLYRGTVIHSGNAWATIQGRPRQGRVRLLAGEKLPEETGGFAEGFVLTVQRRGDRLAVLVGEKEVVSRTGLPAPTRALHLTLETFDPGNARFDLGEITIRRWPAPQAADEKGEPLAPVVTPTRPVQPAAVTSPVRQPTTAPRRPRVPNRPAPRRR